MALSSAQRSAFRAALVAWATTATGASRADTVVPPGELGTQTWSAAGGPYRLSGDVTVAPGSTLLVLAGTRILVADGDSLAAGRDPARTELVVAGALRVEGTAAAPVRLEASGVGPWGGVRLLAGSRGSWIRGALVRGATGGLRYDTQEQNVVEMTTFEGCDVGVEITAGVPILDAITAADGGVGVDVLGGGSANLRNVLVIGNRSHGIRVRNGVAFPTAVNVFNATVHGNGGDGIRAESGTSQAIVNVRNSLVTLSGGSGLVREPKTTLAVEFTDVWSNAAGDAGVISRGPGMLAVDPLYAAPPVSLALTPGSPAAGAGTASVALVRDRAGAPRPLDGAIDLGAFELVVTPFCGDGAITASEVCDDGVWNGRPGFCAGTCAGPAPACGDGRRDPGELCDDGNREDGDGCDAFCGVSGIGFDGGVGAGGIGGAPALDGAVGSVDAEAGAPDGASTPGQGGAAEDASTLPVGGSAGTAVGAGAGGTSGNGLGGTGGGPTAGAGTHDGGSLRRGRSEGEGGCTCTASARGEWGAPLLVALAALRAARRRRRER